MADEDSENARSVVHAPVSKVTISLPFSSINTVEPSEELRELAVVVAGLAERIAKLEPTPETEALADQARALIVKLAR
jgi:hypothetical protein